MARFKEGSLSLEMDGVIDEIFDEGVGNSFLAARTLRWNEKSEFKLDLRKWFVNTEGQEIAGKGFSFITDEGPSNLIKCLLSHGYGDTRSTLEGIQDREDFTNEALRILDAKGAIPKGLYKEEIVDDKDSTFYDPKSLIGDEINE